jgi:Ca-activated chloride channel family protein
MPLLLLNGLLLPGSANADWWDDIWQRKDQQAWRALAEEDAEKAAALARDPDLSGEAWYRSGEFANSLDAWARSESADAHFNRGNALAQMGEYDAAMAAYDEALAAEPGMEDAGYNREVVEQLKEQQQQEQEQQEQGDQGESQDGESSQEQQDGDQQQESQSQQGEDGEPAESGDEDQEAEPSEGEQGEEQGEPQMEPSEAWSEEDAQAMEQWLRRIPDDPGGLLRRKFRNEHLRRGAPDDETETW